MKKILFISFLLLSAFSIQCSSDNNNPNNDENPISDIQTKLLPVSIITGEKLKTFFTYDNQNRIIEIRDEEIKPDYNWLGKINITYNADGKPSEVIIIEEEIETDPADYSWYLKYSFTYDADIVHVHESGSGGLSKNYDLKIDGERLISNLSNSNYLYNYDENLNLISFKNTTPNDTYEYRYQYDNSKNGLFYNSPTPYWLLIFLDENGMYSPNLLINSEEYEDSHTITQYLWGNYKDNFPTSLKTITKEESAIREVNSIINYKTAN